MSLIDIPEMSRLERIQAMEMLWDSLCHDNEEMQSPDWHETILQARKKALDSGEATFMTLEQLKQRRLP